MQAEIRTLPELATLEPEDLDRATESLSSIVTTTLRRKTFRGPIASPGDMADYKRVDPALPGRIVAMAEMAQKRVEDRADNKLYYDHVYRMTCLGLGFGALVTVVIAGVTLIVHGQHAAGIAVLSVGFVGTVIKVFVDGRSSPNPEPASEPGKDRGPPAKR